jgi:SAM-dependent methyltransferase
LASSDLVEYYRRRAGEYEAIYAKPERQEDLAHLKRVIPQRLRGRRVLEVACGTGYWTAGIAAAAASVTATDLADEPMQIARNKTYPENKVLFRKEDAYRLPADLGRFDGAFVGFLWSHVPRERLGEFVASLYARLDAGARVLIVDNTYVGGASTPLSAPDAAGNTYQERALADGSRFRVLKNFPAAGELEAHLPGAVSVTTLKYYWLAETQA